MITGAMGDTVHNIECPKCSASNPSDSSFCNKCGAAFEKKPATLTYPAIQTSSREEALHFSPGDSFGKRYRIIEEIGRGGMGRVYKAEDRELGITVALKMIRPEYSSSRTMIELFKKETLLARSISHENVVRTHDLGEIDGIKYISMDFIKGGNLRDLIQTSKTLSLGTCLQIMLQICRALEAAHQKGIVHQDLKPQNIMIDNSGKVYVTDFGLAKSLAGQEKPSSKKAYGTPQYFSPEQARGEEADERSDIYSMGVILFEMATGKPPFQAKTTEGYIQKHTSEMPVSPSKMNRALPPLLEKIILKCLEKKKENRYQSVEELRKDLEAQKGAPGRIEARPKLSMFRRMAYAAALVLIVAIGFYLIKTKKQPAGPSPSPDRRNSVAVLYSVNNTGDKSLDHLRWEIADLMITGLAQSKYLNILPEDRLRQMLERMKHPDEDQHSSETLDKIAAAENIDYFLLPSFAKAGDNLWISIKIRKARTKEIVDTASVQGKGLENLFAMMDELILKAKSIFIPSPGDQAGDSHQELGKITTNSLEALKFYVESERLYAQYDFEGSIRALEKAVKEDPAYGLAYWKMALDYNYLGNYDQSKKYIEKALNLLNRVSKRDGYLIEGYASYFLDESPVKAIQSYKKLLELYPLDEAGLSYLGAIYRNIEEWDLAIEQFEGILKIDKSNMLAYENLAFIFTAKGWYEKAVDLIRNSEQIFPEVAFFPNQLSLIFLIQGKFDLASAELEKAFRLAPQDLDNFERQSNIYHLQRDFLSARKFYSRLEQREKAPPGLLAQFWLGHLHLMQGEYEQSKKAVLQGIEMARISKRDNEGLELRLLLGYLNIQLKRFPEAVEALKTVIELSEKIQKSPRKKSALHFLGLAYLGLGQIEEAKKTAQQLYYFIEKTGCLKHLRHYYHLAGKIALAEGHSAEALKDLERAISLLPSERETRDEHALYFDALAAACYRAGDFEKALESYTKIISLTTGRLIWGDIYVRSYYWLGKIFQKTGMAAEAAAHYEKFLELWKNADAGLPEIEDARKQLVLLKKDARP